MTYAVHYTGKFYKGLTHKMKSPSYVNKITYEVGMTYTAEDFEVSDDECAPGIHIVTSLAKALKWGAVVIEVSVPEDAQIVWGPDKCRTPVLTVERVADLSGADLSGAYLSGANLSGTNLYGAIGTPYSGMPEGWKLDYQGLWVKASICGTTRSL